MSPLGKRSWWLVGRGDQLLARLGKVPIGDLTDLREKRVRPGAVTPAGNVSWKDNSPAAECHQA